MLGWTKIRLASDKNVMKAGEERKVMMIWAEMSPLLGTACCLAQHLLTAS